MDIMEKVGRRIIKDIEGKLESYEKQSEFFGVEINPERVAELKDLLAEYTEFWAD